MIKEDEQNENERFLQTLYIHHMLHSMYASTMNIEQCTMHA